MGKSRPLYLASTVEGRDVDPALLVRKVPKLKPLRTIFRGHEMTITGESCSKHGLRRISGEDIYTICLDCGKILKEEHCEYL